jgi:hypothetical protein
VLEEAPAAKTNVMKLVTAARPPALATVQQPHGGGRIRVGDEGARL